MKQTRLSSHSTSKQFRRNAVAFGVALAIASSAYANPNGMSVVAGQATAQPYLPAAWSIASSVDALAAGWQSLVVTMGACNTAPYVNYHFFCGAPSEAGGSYLSCRYAAGFCCTPSYKISKCRCGPVTLPLSPTVPMLSPARTIWPG